jgi:hypothetical protein
MEKTTTTTTNKKDGKVQPLFSSLLFRFSSDFSSDSLLFSSFLFFSLVSGTVF